jgi:D-arabinose 5-phosphate isomerase GutQ
MTELSSTALLTKRGFDSVCKSLGFHNEALAHLTHQYQTDEFSQQQLLSSLQLLYTTIKDNRGKIVICGIGKSFKIANKLVATLNSLSINATALHPLEALHGDLGIINESVDTLILLTASGNTPELLALLPHLCPQLPIILLTCNKHSKLSCHPQVLSLLYVELPEALSESTIHGLPAPTVSTSLSLILADATIIALSEMLEEDVLKRKTLFSKKHPGGSIGANLAHLNDNTQMAVSNSVNYSSQISQTSLLSLNKLKIDGNKSNISSQISSDDELGEEIGDFGDDGDIYIKHTPNINVGLSQKIQNSNSVLIVEREVLWTLNDEAKLTKWLALFDYLVLTSTELKNAIEMVKVKQLYRKLSATNQGQDFNWSVFKLNLMLQFSEVRV